MSEVAPVSLAAVVVPVVELIVLGAATTPAVAVVDGVDTVETVTGVPVVDVTVFVTVVGVAEAVLALVLARAVSFGSPCVDLLSLAGPAVCVGSIPPVVWTVTVS